MFKTAVVNVKMSVVN